MGYGYSLPLLAIVMLFIAGCLQPAPPEGNATNQSNGTVPPGGNITNVTQPPQQYPPGYAAKDYCEKDGDCVRQGKCCDCGVGEYVNSYHLEHPDCQGPQCLCPIELSQGKCQANKCVAVPLEQNASKNATNQSAEFYFRTLGKPDCGYQLSPAKNVSKVRTSLSGSIGTSDPCYTVSAELVKVNATYYIVNITSTPQQVTGGCVQCEASTPWLAEINGFNGSVEVYYDGNLAYSDFSPQFCGWGTGECSSDADCFTSGCFNEACQSRFDPVLSTNCDDYRTCFDSYNYSKACGCVNTKCRWFSVAN